MKEATVFFAWQSDLPDDTNRGLIREALHSLIPEWGSRGFRILIDEATRNEAGSPNIPLVIMEKIMKADIFVGDVTLVNGTLEGKVKKTPNPNVVFELGFAVSVLGWKRVILLLNKNYADESELPFDFDRHRVLVYASEGRDRKAEAGQLRSLLRNAIGLILEQNPDKGVTRSSPEAMKRERDLENLRRILSTIHQPTLQEHIEWATKFVSFPTIHFFGAYETVFTDNLFYLYDKKLYERFENLYHAWDKSISFGEFYYPLRDGKKYVFYDDGSEERKEARKEIEQAVREIRDTLKEINEIVRKKYLEIDLKQMSDNAWDEYIAFEDKLESILEK